MKSGPTEIQGARVLYYAILDERHPYTGNFMVNGKPVGPIVALAICHYDEKGEPNLELGLSILAQFNEIVKRGGQTPPEITQIEHMEDEFILFYCDADWNVLTHSHREKIEEFFADCEYACENISALWVKVE